MDYDDIDPEEDPYYESEDVLSLNSDFEHAENERMFDDFDSDNPGSGWL